MVDLSNLKLVEENIEVADDSQYVDASEFPPALPEGAYTLVQGKAEFEATKDGFLQAVMQHVVAGGEHDGQKVMFDRVSSKPFDRKGTKASFLADHLRAVYPVGAPERSARSNDDRANAIAAAEGKSFKATVEWRGYCAHKDTPQASQAPFTVEGARNFPAGQNGHRADTMSCPTCGQSIRAQVRLRRLPAA